jgi:anti-sigma B factor antagonist
MEVNYRKTGDAVVLEIDGAIDLYNAPELKENLSKYLEKKKMVIDMGNVTYIDSSGIGVFISTLSALKKSGGALKLVHVGGTVLTVLKMTRLTSFFEIFENEKDALSSFDLVKELV